MGHDFDVRADWDGHLEEGGGNHFSGRVGGLRFGRREHAAGQGIIWTATAVASPLTPFLSLVVVFHPVVHEVPHQTDVPFYAVLHLPLGGSYPVVGLLVVALLGAALGLPEGEFLSDIAFLVRVAGRLVREFFVFVCEFLVRGSVLQPSSRLRRKHPHSGFVRPFGGGGRRGRGPLGRKPSGGTRFPEELATFGIGLRVRFLGSGDAGRGGGRSRWSRRSEDRRRGRLDLSHIDPGNPDSRTVSSDEANAVWTRRRMAE